MNVAGQTRLDKLKNLIKWAKKYSVFSFLGYACVSVSAFVNVSAYQLQHERDVVQLDYKDKKIRNLEEVADSLRNRNLYQRFQIENLALARVSVERCIEVFPKPAWRKYYDPEKDIFVMDDLNIAYEQKYLFNVTRAQYLGSLDKYAHGGEIADVYEKYDRMALASDEPVIEFAWVRDRRSGKMVFGKFMKWKKKIDGKIFIYGMELEILN